MKTLDSLTIPPELMAELELAVAKAMRRERDPDAMRLACERMDRMREEIFQRVGLLDFAVPAIRAIRDGDHGGSTETD